MARLADDGEIDSLRNEIDKLEKEFMHQGFMREYTRNQLPMKQVHTEGEEQQEQEDGKVMSSTTRHSCNKYDMILEPEDNESTNIEQKETIRTTHLTPKPPNSKTPAETLTTELHDIQVLESRYKRLKDGLLKHMDAVISGRHTDKIASTLLYDQVMRIRQIDKTRPPRTSAFASTSPDRPKSVGQKKSIASPNH